MPHPRHFCTPAFTSSLPHALQSRLHAGHHERSATALRCHGEMSQAPRKPTLSIATTAEIPEVEYTLDLGAETTPLGDDNAPVPPRTRSWRSSSHDRDKQRSTAYDAAGNLKIAARGRREAMRDCGICEEVAVKPVRTQCCGALFCKEHINAWIYGPAATGRCPSCEAPCILPPPTDSSYDTDATLRMSVPPPSPSPAQPYERDSHSLSPGYRSFRPELVRVLCGLALLLLLGLLNRRGAERGTETLTSL
ncbi:hypothetical protein GGX14DRAFT_652713 [Mycena pura]|uniref:RING-type domain-containing protein n=1 Tax=Mycena pura TaxID=153505 RepID=A0AAD6VCJ3_9AGAR|nr:hypothetical protein GGX14DRAFT_652713 [Mycena pura]